MAILFDEYSLIASSGWFDAEFYRREYSDVAAANLDPLVHYLELGARDGRNPCPGFNTQHYLEQCLSLGEQPSNPLYHFLTVGMQLGLTPLPLDLAKRPSGTGERPLSRSIDRSASADHLPPSPKALLCIDVPSIAAGIAQAPTQGGLSIVGWALAREAVTSIVISVDGRLITAARYGLRRPDVAAAYPDWPEAANSGFTAQIPPKALAAGTRRVTVLLRDARGGASSVEFVVEAHAMPAERSPWSLRRRLSQSEIAYGLAILQGRGTAPHFHINILARNSTTVAELARTLRSVGRQAYPCRKVAVLAEDRTSWRKIRSAAFRRDLEKQADVLGLSLTWMLITQFRPEVCGNGDSVTPWIMYLRAGDELGADALLEFAVCSAMEPESDLIYCDDRRPALAEEAIQSFFKPDWSPDLLLSTNYIGRSWVTRIDSGSPGNPAEILSRASGDFDRILRASERANHIAHIPKLLVECSAIEAPVTERLALRAALKRRSLSCSVRQGLVPRGHYVRRKLRGERISIIIATRGTNGLVKACIQSLRERSLYRNYELICIENIPPEGRSLREWLHREADHVIHSSEEFNWSRYNNAAARHSSGSHLLFLNDDVELLEPESLELLLMNSQRPEVGAVGPLLLYPDRTVQHAGLILNSAGVGQHAFRNLPESESGYFGLPRLQRNVTAVTGACLMTSRRIFEDLEGFDEAHRIINNDLDYCLRVREQGLLCVYTPHARLMHYELQSRAGIPEIYDQKKFKARWKKALLRGDQYFNDNLSLEADRVESEWEPLSPVFCGTQIFSRQAVRRILVVKLDHIGDAVIAVPAVELLKEGFPAAKLAIVAGRSTLDFWRSTGLFDEFIEFNLFHARSGDGAIKISNETLRDFAMRIRKESFDLAIDLRKQPDSRFVLEHAGAMWLAGFQYQGKFSFLDIALEWDEDVPLRPKTRHVADDLLGLIEAVISAGGDRTAGKIKARSGPARQPRALSALRGVPYICLHPGAGTDMRRWPIGHYASLVSLLIDESFAVVLIGSHYDRPLAGEIMRKAGKGRSLLDVTGALELGETQQVIAGSALFVGNNSGPQHLAAAIGVPVVAIHGGVVDAREWGPRTAFGVALRREMSCSPCYLERPGDCARGLACLTGISVHQVYQACLRALSLPTGSPSQRTHRDSALQRKRSRAQSSGYTT